MIIDFRVFKDIKFIVYLIGNLLFSEVILIGNF